MSDKKKKIDELMGRNKGGGSVAPITGMDDSLFDVFDEVQTATGAQSLSIFDIRPDLSQPRRVIPMVVRGEWLGDAGDVPALIERWEGLAVRVHGESIPVIPLLMQEDVAFDAPEDSGVAGAFVDLLRLASGIKADGLINPITVASSDAGYVIETGERRWLAHHVLNHYLGSHEKVLAKVQDNLDVFRQAAENNQRRDLNAIGMARQYALLVMALLKEEGHRFERIEAFDLSKGDQGFYSQVAGMRIPYGQSSRVFDAMGINNRQSIKELKDLLEIDPELWVRADSDDMSRSEILAEAGLRVPKQKYAKADNSASDGQLSVMTDNSQNTPPPSGRNVTREEQLEDYRPARPAPPSPNRYRENNGYEGDEGEGQTPPPSPLPASQGGGTRHGVSLDDSPVLSRETNDYTVIGAIKFAVNAVDEDMAHQIEGMQMLTEDELLGGHLGEDDATVEAALAAHDAEFGKALEFLYKRYTTFLETLLKRWRNRDEH